MLRRSLVLLALAASSFSHAEDLRAVAQRLLAEGRKATLAKDMGYADRTYAPNFVTVGLQGQRFSRAQVIAERKQLLPLLDLRSADAQVLKVEAYRNGMVVSFRSHTAGFVRDPRTRKPHPLAINELSDETWMKTSGGWKLRMHKVWEYAMTIDGKRRKG